MSKFFLMLLVAFAMTLSTRAFADEPASQPASQPAELAIDEAQITGVSGHPIGIFGSAFGETQSAGKVTILGADAKITKWTDTVIEAVVPTVDAGKGELVITNSAGKSVSGPFEVYTIDPKFLARPDDLVNLAYKKPFVVTGNHGDWGGKPADFLGYNVNHGANMMVPFAAAVDLGEPLHEDVWFSIFGGTDYYTGGEIPTAYTIDVSSDSKDGTDGTWKTLAIITDNTHKSRIHKVTLAGEHWIRLNVSAMNPDPKVKFFRIIEIRVYKRKAPGAGPVDFINIMGDSITYADMGATGPTALDELLAKAKGNDSSPATYVMGLVGANAGPLAKSTKPENAYSMANAIKLLPDAHFFGIAFGTNDSNNPAFAPDYKRNLSEGVEQLMDAGMVPILARLPDTDKTRHGYGTDVTKKQAVHVVDEIDAKYHLIPGPDFYTPFRQDHKGLISDGTHHTQTGGALERRMWADVLLRAGVYGNPPGK